VIHRGIFNRASSGVQQEQQQTSGGDQASAKHLKVLEDKLKHQDELIKQKDELIWTLRQQQQQQQHPQKELQQSGTRSPGTIESRPQLQLPALHRLTPSSSMSFSRQEGDGLGEDIEINIQVPTN
jgi:hypothetical protein